MQITQGRELLIGHDGAGLFGVLLRVLMFEIHRAEGGFVSATFLPLNGYACDFRRLRRFSSWR
jgi:hypothetical protein